MNKLYRVREFAELAGVTVRALHHYDHLGLLNPGRTAAGHRLYSLRDFERLEQLRLIENGRSIAVVSMVISATVVNPASGAPD